MDIIEHLVAAIQDATIQEVYALWGVAALSLFTGVALVTIRVISLGRQVTTWSSEVTTLLGNHLSHKLDALTEEVRGLKHSAEHQEDLLTEQNELLRQLASNVHRHRST